MRVARLEGYFGQVVAGWSARRIHAIEITQGGLGAQGGVWVLLISAFAHDPRL